MQKREVHEQGLEWEALNTTASGSAEIKCGIYVLFISCMVFSKKTIGPNTGDHKSTGYSYKMDWVINFVQKK